MEALFEFLFANIFLVIIIVSGLISLMNNSRKNQQKQATETKSDQDQNTKKTKQSPIGEAMEQFEEMFESFAQSEVETKEKSNEIDNESSETIDPSFSDLRNEQYERLRAQIQTDPKEDMESVEQYASTLSTARGQKRTNDGRRTSTSSFSKRLLNERLTREGLIDSVIMAEVIGPPKARKRIR